MSFNVSQHVKEKETYGQTYGQSQPNRVVTPYQTEQGINMSELARRAAAEEEEIRRREDEARTEVKEKNPEAYKNWLKAQAARNASRQRGETGEQWYNNAKVEYDAASKLLADLKKTKASNAKIEETAKRLAKAQKQLAYAGVFRYSDITSDKDYQSYINKGKSILNSTSDAAEEIKNGTYSPTGNKVLDFFYRLVAPTASTGYGGSGSGQAMNAAVQAHRQDTNDQVIDNEKWTKDEKNTYLYLLGRDGEESARQYAIEINSRYSQEAQQAKQEKISEWSNKNALNGAVGTAASIVGNALGAGIGDFANYAAELAGKGYISDKDYLTPTQISSVVQSSIAQSLNEKSGTINENVPVIGGKGLGDAYQIAASVVNSWASIGVGGEVGSLMSFFGNAAAQGTADALNRGLAPEKAIALGFCNGLAEVIGEKFSVDNLIHIKSSRTLGQFFKSVAAQAGVEGSEEGFTTLLNTLADNLINGDLSEYNQRVNSLMAQGMGYDEAKVQASKEWINDTAYDILSGAASGGISGVGGTFRQSLSYNGTDSQLLIDTARQVGSDKEVLRATEIERNVADSKSGKLTRGEAGELYQIIEDNGGMEILEQMRANSTQNKEESKTSAEDTARTYVEQTVEDLDVPEQAAQILLSGYETGDANAQDYVQGIKEAFKAGQLGVDYEQARQDAVFGQKLNDLQYRHAYQIGAQKAGLTPNLPALPATSEANTETATPSYGSIEEFSSTFSSPEQVTQIYDQTPETDLNVFQRDFQRAYDMGQSGVSASYLNDQTIPGLTADQRQAAYQMGQSAATTQATSRDTRIAQNRKAGNLNRAKGTVKGEGVTIADMRAAFNDSQNTAFRLLTRYAETTGVNIVLYNSQADSRTGMFPEEQGRFQWRDNAIYVDINSGLNNINDVNDLGKYTMLRTFAHEFTHFIEKWNPTRYNEFRQFVFQTLEAKGENVNDLIESMQMRDSSGKMTYEQASREVVADAMMDILPDSTLVQQLAQEHQTIFQQLLKRLRDFAARMRQYYNQISTRAPREAQALKENNSYMKSIVDMWDSIAKGAVENYQQTFGEEFLDQPAKPENLPKRNAKQQRNNAQIREENSQIAEEMPVSAANMPTEPERMPIGRDYFPANDFTSQAEAGPDLRNMVPRMAEPVEESRVEETPTAPEVAQEVVIDKQLDKLLRKADRVYTIEIDGKHYISTAATLIPVTKEAADFAETSEGYKATKMPGTRIKSMLEADYTSVTAAPTEGKAGQYTVYKFSTPSGNVLFDKNLFRFFDGGRVYISDGMIMNRFRAMRVMNEDGTLKGYLLPISGLEVENEKPTKLKSFSGKLLKAAQNEARDREETKRPETPPVVEKPAQPTQPAQNESQKPKSRFPLLQWKRGTTSQKAAYRILMDYLRQNKGMPSTALYEICDKAFGGTQAEGKYNRKDAYDAMELAVNQYLLENAGIYNSSDVEVAQRGVEFMQRLLSNLPTQNVRTQEQLEFQQFSTPPSIAYLAAWAANINEQDSMLEPSAGIGGLAAFAKAWGAEVTVNELSERRFGIIQALGFDNFFNENAEHIDDILPDNIQPTVVVMNPPFSSTAGRTKSNKTSNAEAHINSALDRLADNGRLVAILGRGMADDKYSKYWNKLRQEYTIRANIGIDGKNYTKYGTSFDVQIVVIDKVGPQGDVKTFTGNYTDLSQVPAALEGIRNDRSTEVERNTSVARDTETVGKSEEEQLVPAAMDQGDNTRSGGNESGNRDDTGRGGESGSTDLRGVNGNAERVQDAGARGRGTVERQQSDQKNPRGRKTTEQSEGLRSDTSTAGVTTDVQRESGQQRSRPESESARRGQVEEQAVSDDGVYATYRAPALTTSGSRAHPATLVESAAMAAVDMPPATYTPHLPENVIRNSLSDAQMVSITYAGQAHEQKLPNGERRGFFIGDGTGVGKGRQISGIILDNFEQGRKKAIWISEKQGLFNDAQRDWTDTTGRSKDEVKNLQKVKVENKIDLKEGIIYTTYDTLRGGNKTKSRVQQLAEWFGKDYDGVIAFDEAHNMGNLLGKAGKFGKSRGSDKAIAAVELQRLLPNARVIYVSATAATDVDGLAFASRLGLWGEGTAFTDVKDFVNKIGSSGLSAMELVVRDMKAMGMYVARSISYNGVEYGTIQHDLDPVQTQIYNTMSRAWQNTMRSVEQSLIDTGAQHNARAKQRAIGQYFGAIQRFYNQVLTSMSMPSVIADMKKQLADGKSCVLQLVNTNQAEAERQIASIKAEGDELDDMDLTPRGTLVNYLMECYPVTKFEEYEDEDGNLRSRPVTNSKGEPVVDKKAVAKRDALIAEINEMSIPDGPLEMLFDAFGTENVSEITGRTRRVVPRKQADGTIKRVEEKRTASSKEADVTAFQNGDKRILVFNNAGGTGKSYHADNRAKNRQQRVHYVLQPGWEASRAVQGFGRTHRSNEASAPIYKLITTNIKGQKRFTSTIARRLDQLGALTKGQRDTGSGMFGASDNLETDLAKDSLREFYNRLGKNMLEGINGKEVLRKLGLLEKFTGEYGEFKMNDSVARDIGKFLNRILALEVDEQNEVFDAFLSIYEAEMDAAIQAGTLDRGMENVKADKIEIVDDKVIHEQKGTGAATHYVQAKVYTKPKVISTVAQAEQLRTGFIGIYRTKDGDVRAVYQLPDKTDQYGRVHKQYKIQSPNASKSNIWIDTTFNREMTEVPKGEWQQAWDEELKKVPEFNEETKHMLTGSLLPIWNSLPTEGNTKVQRLITDDGKAYLGRIIAGDQIDKVLSRFQVNRTRETFTGQNVMDRALKNGEVFNLTLDRAKIQRSRVSGEWRLEYIQPMNTWSIKSRYPGMIAERINFQNRFFIPTNETGVEILNKMLEYNPVANSAVSSENEYATRRDTISNRELLGIAAQTLDDSNFTAAEKDALRIFQERAGRLQMMQLAREDLGKQYKEQQFGKGGSRAEAEQTYSAMKTLDTKIKALENNLLGLENKEVLKRVLEKARNIVETQERERGSERLRQYRERRNESEAVRKNRARVKTEAETLRKWLINPSSKDVRQHVPAELQKTVADFLDSINFASQTALRTGGAEITKADERYLKNMRKMHDAIKHNVDARGAYSGYADLPEDFLETFEKLIRAAEGHISGNSGTFVINQMTARELNDLYHALKTLRKYITTMNVFHNNAMFQHASDAAEETIDHLKKFEKSKKSGTIYKFLRFDYMRPSYAFEHFGKGGQSIENEFREGQATQAFLANKIIDFAKKTYTGKEVREWSKETKTFELDNGENITLPITHIMSLYALNKRPQALTHIYGDGIRVANYKQGGTVQLDEGHIVSLSDVQRMIDSLSDRQRAVADALQKFMSTETAKWGNYVSMARFDVEQFTEETYFPINSDGRYLSNTADESPDNASLYALLNSGFTKELKEGADNRIILYNVFDVFANHTASMTQYRAFALPVLDALKWFNYKNDTTSVRTKLSSAFGAPADERAGSGSKGYAEQFVINLLKAYNGTAAQGDPYDNIPLKMLHHFNGAAIAYNLRVVIQQPTAITRAAMILSPAKLTKGLGMSIAQMQKLADEMERHSGIAAWKALGFYDTNISRGLTDLIKQNPGALDRVMEVGTKGAEVADRFTWAAMWYAAKDSVDKSKYKTNDEYMKAVTELFEDVIYKTQVVDSLLSKAEFLRSKGGIARQMGSFMSEPSATMSMLADAYFKYTDDMQQGLSRSEAWQRNGKNIAKTAAVYAVGQVILSAMQAVIDAWRDQDDEDSENWLKNYIQKYLNAFKSNVIEEELIFGKIPLVSELYELMKGYLDKFGVFDKLGLDIYGNDTASGLAMYTKYLSKAVEIIAGKVTGDSKYNNYTDYGIIYNLIRAASNLSGIPFATAWREVQDIWNNTVGYFNPSKKLVTYQRAVDRTYNEQIQQTGLGKSTFQNILDDADTVHGDGNGSIKQDELGAALVTALEEGKITEDQAQAVWNTKGWKKTFDGWRGLGSDIKTETTAEKSAKAPAATTTPAAGSVRSYDDFKKVPVYDSAAKQALFNVWESSLKPSGMSLDRFAEIITKADTDGNDSLKQDEMGTALLTAMQKGELTFDQCDAIWRTQWNKARSKTFAKWLNG